MKDIILEFIKRRFSSDCCWLNGNCYYFAVILQTRFPELKKIYFPITGHWACMDDMGDIYDWDGECKIKEVYYTEEWMAKNETDYYLSLLKDSII